jgi:hypothetical protein
MTIPEGCILNFYCCVNLKSRLLFHVLNICLAPYTYSIIIIIIIIIIIVVLVLQLFVGTWPLFQFRDNILCR